MYEATVEWFSHHYFISLVVTVANIFITMGILALSLRKWPLPFSTPFNGLLKTAVVGLSLTAVMTLSFNAFQGGNRADDDREAAIRANVEAKYAVAVDEWGVYLGRHRQEQTSIWTIDGKTVTCTAEVMDSVDDEPLIVCGGSELPLRNS